MEQSQIRAMIVARQFLERAELLAENGTETDHMGAVVLADLAVEMAAKAAARDQPLPDRARLDRDPTLPVLLGALTKLWQQGKGTEEDVPEVRGAGRLHDLRNGVQHRGLAPASDLVAESLIDARRFLRWAAREWFGVPLETISRAQLIASQTVRSLVEEAEQLAAKENYATAAERLAVAFEMARQQFRAEGSRGRYSRPVRATEVGAALAGVRKATGDRSAGLPWREVNEFLSRMADQIEKLTDQVEAVTLGARASDYAWFKRSFPEVYGVMRQGMTHLSATARADITRAVYPRGLEFVTATALHWPDFPPPPDPFAEPAAE